MRSFVLLLAIVSSLGLKAQDSLGITPEQDEQRIIRQLDAQQPLRRKSWLRRTLERFTYIDTAYVEPQHYNWSAMLQTTYNYDFYRLSSVNENRQSFDFSPKVTAKFGPYFGWRWVFLGYTFDLTHVDVSQFKQEVDFSFYSAQIGADFSYRRTGSDYRLNNVRLGDDINSDALEGVPFDGISVGITGINVYYIFNHQRFSYPAAFSQSTCQKISCGSWMAGMGYMRNTIDFDHERLQALINERLPDQQIVLDDGLTFSSVKYYDINFSGGYAYNWVFAKNFLFCASLSAVLAYKKTKTKGSSGSNPFRFSEFSLKNVNIDGVGRFGLVFNDTRWYAGTSAIVRAYNYRKSRFAANNVFGNINVYVGYNFGLRKEYKKK